VFRPTASDVSALWGFVANGRQTLHDVSFSPSKIPYGGFSPVRLQAGLSDVNLHPRGNAAAAYMTPVVRASPGTALPHCVGTVRRSRGLSGPEALGSPAGCVVPPGRRLLRPHPRLRPAPAALGLAIRRRASRGPQGPQFTPRILLPVPSPIPRRIGRCGTIRVPPASAFAQSEMGSASARLRANRYVRGSGFEAAEFALCCGPGSCSPRTDRGFYIRACVQEVASVERRT
jgi:hypothetical protein